MDHNCHGRSATRTDSGRGARDRSSRSEASKKRRNNVADA